MKEKANETRLLPDQVRTQSNFMFSASTLMESKSTEDR